MFGIVEAGRRSVMPLHVGYRQVGPGRLSVTCPAAVRMRFGVARLFLASEGST